MPTLVSSAHPKRILLVRPSALGDVCRSVPVLASLRSAFPDAAIDWIVQSEFAPAIASHPALTEAITFPRKEFSAALRSPAVARGAVGWLKGLRERRYDIAFDLQGLGRSGMMVKATGAPRRIGFRDARELGWLGYNVRHEPPPPGTHTVDRMLALLKAEGITAIPDMRLYVSEEDRAWWRQRMPGRYAVLAPTARWPSKRWPIERWRELIKPLLMRGFEAIVVIAAPGEEPQLEPLTSLGARGNGSPEWFINLAGKCTIGQTMAVIESAGFLLANDSAPLHMAVGLGAPCLGLFGPTDPAIVGPYGKPRSALRAFKPRPGEIINYRDPKLEDRLMRVISTAAVLQRLDLILANEPQPEPRAPRSPAANRSSSPALYLASSSPRRRLLLEEMGIKPQVMPPDLDDGRLSPGIAPVHDRVLGLAYLKARRVADQLHARDVREGIVLGADTLCVHEGSALGQPRNAEHARQMLTSMRRCSHTTVTGVCLIDLANDRRVLFHDEAAVRIGEVSDDEISSYIASGEWRGKAGAYNLSERIDAGWEIECDGDPATVMGLPIRRLESILQRFASAADLPAGARQPERAAT